MSKVAMKPHTLVGPLPVPVEIRATINGRGLCLHVSQLDAATIRKLCNALEQDMLKAAGLPTGSPP